MLWQPISVKTVSQHQVGRGGAHVTLVGVPSKKPVSCIIFFNQIFSTFSIHLK